MLPTVDGKLLFDCVENDLKQILNNPDYRENEYIDYKVMPSHHKAKKGDKDYEQHKSEFRNDVCSFANANGGYLVYGISDDRGMAKELVGFEIENDDTDKFERNQKDILGIIQPKMPTTRFRFIHLENGKYIVIVHVFHDTFGPYIHLKGDNGYGIYVRVNNGKSVMSYTELKNQFNQSISLEKEIRRFREERITDFVSIEDNDKHWYSQFLLLNIIPDTFLDTSHNKPLFALMRNRINYLNQIFSGVGCCRIPIPNVDGLRFIGGRSGEESQLYNNGCAEVFLPLNELISFDSVNNRWPFGFLATVCVWEKIQPVISEYCTRMGNILDTKRIFVCLSILGCKGVTSDYSWEHNYVGTIDRNKLLCNPVIIDNITEKATVELSIKKLGIEYGLSIGNRYSKELLQLIEEVYQ